jgi:hypothetical protein
MIPRPTKDQAEQFALMLSVGLPPNEAILYFIPEEDASDPSLVVAYRDRWLSSPQVRAELNRLQGGSWEAMPLQARIQTALDKHYAEKAYFLYSHNYSELSGAELSKAQEARKVLEAKMAGTSGKVDALSQFLDDLRTGKAKVGPQQAKVDLVVN